MRCNALHVVIAGTAMSLGFAVPAAADTGDYLQALQDTYPTLSTQQLLSTGAMVCNATSSGMNSPQIVTMVQRNIGVSVPAALDIVSAAVLHLDC
jgi:hypothetical protein